MHCYEKKVNVLMCGFENDLERSQTNGMRRLRKKTNRIHF